MTFHEVARMVEALVGLGLDNETIAAIVNAAIGKYMGCKIDTPESPLGNLQATSFTLPCSGELNEVWSCNRLKPGPVA